MIPRLRVLFVTPDVHVLVLDRMGNVSRAEAEAMMTSTKTAASVGTLIFPFEVDIPDADDREAVGTKVHADELAALRSIIDLARIHWRDETGNKHADTLDLLLERIEESL